MHPDHSSAGSNAPSRWAWLPLLFFRPTKFFIDCAERVPFAWIALGAWMLGWQRSSAHAERKFLTGQDVPFQDDWGKYWLLLLAAGVLSGLTAYWLGGWFYRLRIQWSGDPGAAPRLARRIYILAGVVGVLPSLVLSGIETRLNASPVKSFQAEYSWWHAGFLIFPFWSFVCSYRGVRARFSVRPWPARIWFFVLPTLFLAVVLIGMRTLSFVHPVPNVDSPIAYRGENLSLQLPGNWWTEEAYSEDGAEGVSLIGMADARIAVDLYFSTETPRVEMEYTASLFEQDLGWTKDRELQEWRGLKGFGASGRYSDQGTPCTALTFVSGRLDRRLEISAFYATAHEEFVTPVLDLLARSVEWQ